MSRIWVASAVAATVLVAGCTGQPAPSPSVTPSPSFTDAGSATRAQQPEASEVMDALYGLFTPADAAEFERGRERRSVECSTGASGPVLSWVDTGEFHTTPTADAQARAAAEKLAAQGWVSIDPRDEGNSIVMQRQGWTAVMLWNPDDEWTRLTVESPCFDPAGKQVG